MSSERAASTLRRLAKERRLPSPARCRRIREQAGVTLEEIAAVVGTSAMSVSRWERGLAHPRGRHRAAYAAALRALEDAAR